MMGRIIQGSFQGGIVRDPSTGKPARAQDQADASMSFSPFGSRALTRRNQRLPTIQASGSKSFAVDPAQLGLNRGGGAQLPQPILAKMGAAFGADFSNVRVHTGPQASRIGALAFAIDGDLYFAPGHYQPGTVRGQQLIGHELAHVLQQRQGRVAAPGSGVAVVQDRRLEAEAELFGRRAAMPQATDRVLSNYNSAAKERIVASNPRRAILRMERSPPSSPEAPRRASKRLKKDTKPIDKGFAYLTVAKDQKLYHATKVAPGKLKSKGVASFQKDGNLYMGSIERAAKYLTRKGTIIQCNVEKELKLIDFSHKETVNGFAALVYSADFDNAPNINELRVALKNKFKLTEKNDMKVSGGHRTVGKDDDIVLSWLGKGLLKKGGELLDFDGYTIEVGDAREFNVAKSRECVKFECRYMPK